MFFDIYWLTGYFIIINLAQSPTVQCSCFDRFVYLLVGHGKGGSAGTKKGATRKTKTPLPIGYFSAKLCKFLCDLESISIP